MLWIVIAFVLLALLVLFALKPKSVHPEEHLAYCRTDFLFSPAERSFLGVLEQAVGTEVRVFGKVRVGDLLAPPLGLGKSAYRSALNRIAGKHFDFVLCRAGDLAVLCAVELHDRSHRQRGRQERDEFLRAACQGAGLPLLEFDVRPAYPPDEIRQRVSRAIAGKGAA